MLRAILFDWNGVLIDDEPIHLELMAKILSEEGVGSAAGDLERFIGINDRDAFAAAFSAAGRPLAADHAQRLVARKAAYYQLRIRRDGYPVFEGAETIVRSAQAAGLVLGVVSGALRSEIESALERIGWRASFKVLVAAEDVERGKPDPEGYLHGIEQLNSLPPLPSRLFHPHEVLAVEDSLAGLAAAAGAGFLTLGVAQTHPRTALAAADLVVGSLAELTLAELQRRFGHTL